MFLNFPHRFVWLFIGVVMFMLLQSGCQPIPSPAALPTALPTTSATATTQPEYRPPTETLQESTSPNGEWTASTLYQKPETSTEYRQVFTVTHQSGVPSYTIIDSWSNFGFGYTLPAPLFWSEDGERLYYTNFPHPDGCGLFINASDLYRVDLTTGEVSEMLAPNSTSTLAISLDEQQIAYLTWGNPTIVIRDLATQAETTVDIAPYMNLDPNVTQDTAGAFVWSPDSTQLAFVIAHMPCIGGWAQATSIYTLDTETLALTPMIEEDDRLLRPIAWPSDKTLLLENASGNRFELDIATSEITSAP